MNFEHTSEFDKELKRFCKKYRSLEDDLKSFKKVIRALYADTAEQVAPFQAAFFDGKRATRLSRNDQLETIKARLDCASLNSDKLRIIFIVHGTGILFVELYAKNEKAREDSTRIQRYTNGLG